MSSPYLPHRHAVPRKDRRSTPPPASRGRRRALALLAGLPGLLRGLLGRDTLAGIAVAVLATLAMLALTQAQADAALARQRTQLRQQLNLAASHLQAELARALAAADTLAVLAASEPDAPAFERASGALRERFPLLSLAALAPAGVVRHISPASLAPALAGRQLLDDPLSRSAAREALQGRRMAVAVTLTPPGGGLGPLVLGFQPVLRSGAAAEAPGGGPAWGLVVVGVRLPELNAALAAARLDPAELRLELDHLDPTTRSRVRLTPPALGDAAAAVVTELALPGHRLTLRALAREPWQAGPALALAAAALGLLSGLLCTLLLRRQRRRAVRSRYFASSQLTADWGDDFDRALAQLMALGEHGGLAVVAAVRLPEVGLYQRAGAKVAHGEQRDWTGLIHRTKRGDDMLLHLQGNDFLIAARGLPSREVAARVRRRLHHQLHELTAMACGPGVTPLRLHSAAFDPQQTDPGHVLARLLVALHAHDADAPAARPAAGPGVKPARGSVPYTRSAPVTGE